MVQCLRSIGIMFAALALVFSDAEADDWSRFRGPDGSGVVSHTDDVPLRWSPNANVAWKTPLPGPGVSSPIVVDGKVFVTCYSGYGLDREDPGDMNELMRHLICVELSSGKMLWQRDVKATLPEDPYSGVGVPAHGYASHTPVSDGINVYAFFGKGGVHAFDLDGKPLWQIGVGMESDPAKWGSSSSPIIYDDTVIVTASAESQSIIGLDKETGNELWRQEASGLDGMWGTPTLVKTEGGRTDLVMCVAKEIWGLDPASGKMRWYADATGAENAYSSVVTDGSTIYAVTGRGGGSVAIQAGGSGDISETSTLWTGNDSASFASPVQHGDKLYVVAQGVLTVIDATTGDKVNQVRLRGAKRTGGRFGSLDYASPIVVGDSLLYLNGSGQTFVFDLTGEVKQVAINEVTTEKETFGGSPAVADGRIVLRSSQHLFCLADLGDDVPESSTAPEDRVASDAGGGPGPGAGGPGRGAGGPGGGGGRFDPMSIFNGRDTNGDGSLSKDEVAASPMADRMATLDKDDDGLISKEEFRTGMSTLFRGGGSGRGGSGGGYGRGNDNRPKRPQRPAMAG